MRKILFHEYFEEWINLYKKGAIREVTFQKYETTLSQLKQLAPNLQLRGIGKKEYHQYAQTHEKITTLDFHHHLKACLLDALDENLLSKDPTRKIVIKGTISKKKRKKFLNQFELNLLLNDLNLGDEISWDWFILLLAKSGIRFSEGLALTPMDFDFERQCIFVNKTWNYKDNLGGFQPTKNSSSKRKVLLDKQILLAFKTLTKQISPHQPIFAQKRVFNACVNACLVKHCQHVGIPEISLHALRHTHASILLFSDVSIASVSKRLGHSTIHTTQSTYLHIIRELEDKDNMKILEVLEKIEPQIF